MIHCKIVNVDHAPSNEHGSEAVFWASVRVEEAKDNGEAPNSADLDLIAEADKIEEEQAEYLEMLIAEEEK